VKLVVILLQNMSFTRQVLIWGLFVTYLSKFVLQDDLSNPVTDSDTITVDHDKGVIDFRPLKREHDGKYRCRASNDVGHVDSEGSLSVLSRLHSLCSIAVYPLLFFSQATH
jgi:hypothetical protein